MRFTEPVCEVGQPVHAIIAYRGAGKPEPVLKITHNDAPSREAAATVLPGDGTAGREWAAVVTPDRPGRWKVRVADRNNLEGEAMLTVAAPPTEANDPRPNSESLQTLARGSG